MSLNERERMVHMCTAMGILGELHGEPASLTKVKLAEMAKERCRKLTMQDIDEIMSEVDVDAIACHIVMDYLANEKQSHFNGGNIC